MNTRKIKRTEGQTDIQTHKGMGSDDYAYIDKIRTRTKQPRLCGEANRAG